MGYFESRKSFKLNHFHRNTSKVSRKCGEMIRMTDVTDVKKSRVKGTRAVNFWGTSKAPIEFLQSV